MQPLCPSRAHFQPPNSEADRLDRISTHKHHGGILRSTVAHIKCLLHYRRLLGPDRRTVRALERLEPGTGKQGNIEGRKFGSGSKQRILLRTVSTSTRVVDLW